MKQDELLYLALLCIINKPKTNKASSIKTSQKPKKSQKQLNP
ncbi:hypothetical protein [Breznakia pachnodae]|uniref:Uncharacterized protein n=1 Tax=Breznakia pachnodae TaxID=265178 RepID=A0ABU0DYZ1_9FIRM|nr:hypothetical protein [Breznakia pachnodae]MDQ0359719.1 hypothetical protein [Breznakia pachnodae]